MTTPELRSLLHTVELKLDPVRKCLHDIDQGWEEDVADHYDCTAELRQLANDILEATNA